MNYRELCVETAALLRIAEQLPADYPLDAPPASAPGRLGEIAAWVASADLDIQNGSEGWRFLRAEATPLLNAGSPSLAPAAVVADYDEPLPMSDGRGVRFFTLASQPDLSDEMPLYYVPWGQWHGSVYDRGARGHGRPYRCTVRPDGALLFDPVPDQAYTLRLPYRLQSRRMTAATDVSRIPARHRQAIVWRTIARYYGLSRDGTSELVAKADRELRRAMTDLERTQLPEYTLGGVL